MSAAPLPSPSTPIKAACFTPLSYFERLLDMQNYTQLRCYSLILVETLGHQSGRIWAEIDTAAFVQATVVTKEWVYAALESLGDNGYKLIRSRTNTRGRTEYALRAEHIQEAKGAGRLKIPGKCPDCQAVGLFDTEFIPVLHAALRKMGACVDPATFKCVMVVIRYTLKWDKETKALRVDPSELDINDFERLTGLENREICNGLTRAGQLGLIGREMRKGKPSIFWLNPEAFANLERRTPRTVSPPQHGVKDGANVAIGKIAENSAKQPESTATESPSYFYGRCPSCWHFVNFEPVTEEEVAAKPAERPPRAGPWPQKKPISRHDQTREVLRRRYEAGVYR